MDSEHILSGKGTVKRWEKTISSICNSRMYKYHSACRVQRQGICRNRDKERCSGADTGRDSTKVCKNRIDRILRNYMQIFSSMQPATKNCLCFRNLKEGQGQSLLLWLLEEKLVSDSYRLLSFVVSNCVKDFFPDVDALFDLMDADRYLEQVIGFSGKTEKEWKESLWKNINSIHAFFNSHLKIKLSVSIGSLFLKEEGLSLTRLDREKRRNLWGAGIQIPVFWKTGPFI